eukprot:CAMPEP_0182816186 /NCGR_PEP_ID=MMETSP0006_2-20121128/10803_1 /TAXON_ID=97485 /ORGANISM="Prymnesium parvum, Strain Texoma1" /LENGTH=48 /DNA_ID= /DNA_START= /DNA_END= /DNA_ORIENTATION=
MHVTMFLETSHMATLLAAATSHVRTLLSREPEQMVLPSGDSASPVMVS